MLLEARERAGKSDERPAPPLATWSPEVNMLATIVDELRKLHYAIWKSQAPKANVPTPDPYPRPRTSAEKVRHEMREQRHKALAARMLPHRRES